MKNEKDIKNKSIIKIICQFYISNIICIRSIIIFFNLDLKPLYFW